MRRFAGKPAAELGPGEFQQYSVNYPSPLYQTEYRYDNLGNLARVTRASNDALEQRVVDYAYDGLNRLRKETQYPQGGAPENPNGSTTAPTLVTQYEYDANSNRQSIKQPLDTGENKTSFGYDPLNRLTSIDYSSTAHTPDVTYSYDPHGLRFVLLKWAASPRKEARPRALTT